MTQVDDTIEINQIVYMVVGKIVNKLVVQQAIPRDDQYGYWWEANREKPTRIYCPQTKTLT